MLLISSVDSNYSHILAIIDSKHLLAPILNVLYDEELTNHDEAKSSCECNCKKVVTDILGKIEFFC